jgi:hypothetical protein
MELIANGVQWYYLSYDHKRAIEALSQQYPLINATPKKGFHHEWIPDEIKQQFPLWKMGKLRSMRFDPDGMINRLYVGHMFKYAKCFFPSQLGKELKPILHPNSDTYGLIKAGLAIDETLIKV